MGQLYQELRQDVYPRPGRAGRLSHRLQVSHLQQGPAGRRGDVWVLPCGPCLPPRAPASVPEVMGGADKHQVISTDNKYSHSAASTNTEITSQNILHFVNYQRLFSGEKKGLFKLVLKHIHEFLRLFT